MSVVTGASWNVLSIEECLNLETPLRHELEVLDYEIRGLLARSRGEARNAGADDALFVRASTTVLLVAAAGLIARAAEDQRAHFDARAFAECADGAARWAKQRRLRYELSGEA
jgi:hypothetical protein